MSGDARQLDALIIGGGFYGCAIALHLAEQHGLKHITLLEREPELMARASYNNQARLHNGYHYPRSFTTAFRSRINLPRFVHDWPQVVKKDFTKLYAIARRNSKVTARQFERFCLDVGAVIKPASPIHAGLFEPRLIEAVFEVQEYAFDSRRLHGWALEQLRKVGVNVVLNTTATALRAGGDHLNADIVTIKSGADDEMQPLCADMVFNCTYAGLNQFTGDFPGTKTHLKHEITEMALVEVPMPLKEVGVTVMDGPFFSLMPFPARDLHTLSHVRYTPHRSWEDHTQTNPYQQLASYEKDSRFERMMRDAARYMPSIASVKQEDSLFEVKTVLQKSEGDDSRPILFEQHRELPGCYSVLGGKIDNIYDVLEHIDAALARRKSESL